MTRTGLKVRLGFTCRGTSDLPLDRWPRLVDDLEDLGFDSVWIPEVMMNGGFDPLIALAHAAARTTKLKIGTHLIAPGRSPVRMARELAQLDRLSDGRLLLIMVLGLPDPAEILAQDVEKAERGALLDELLPLLRRLWSGESVDHDGSRYRLRDARVVPSPIQEPLEMWLGGQLPGALRRAGTLGDGWIPGFIDVADAIEKRQVVEEAASAAGRAIDPEHFGINLAYRRSALTPEVEDGYRRRLPDADLDRMIPEGRGALRDRIGEWVDAGFSKILLRPVEAPQEWTRELCTLADDVLDLQT